MPRKPRFEAPGAIQHVIARGNAGMQIVFDDDDRRTILAALGRTVERDAWRVHAYCLMNNHLHLVVETPEPTLGSGMRRLIGGYAAQFNKRHDRYGHLFGGRYAASLIDTEAYAIQVCAYVVLNPVRAGLAGDPADWKWSSYRASAGLVTTPSFLETSLVPGLLHPDVRRAQTLYRDHIRELAEHPRTGSG